MKVQTRGRLQQKMMPLKYEQFRTIKKKHDHIKNYYKNIESSYIQYLDANNQCAWTVSQKLPVNACKWKKIHQKTMIY